MNRKKHGRFDLIINCDDAKCQLDEPRRKSEHPLIRKNGRIDKSLFTNKALMGNLHLSVSFDELMPVIAILQNIYAITNWN